MDASRFLVPTPSVPGLPALTRRRRQLPNPKDEKEIEEILRHDPDALGSLINNRRIEFYIGAITAFLPSVLLANIPPSFLRVHSGFDFDSYDFYRNLSEAVSPEVGRLSVYFAPEFEGFDKTLKYDPKTKEPLHVPVSDTSSFKACG